MSFPKHCDYKDSGIAWLGRIPMHWDVSQSRRLFALRNERANPGDEQLTASQDHGVIPQKVFMELEGRRVVQVILNAEILKHVEPGDFVISMRSFQGGIEYATHRGCISSAYVMLIPSPKVHGPFFKYLLKSQTYIQALQSTTNLVRDGQALRYQNFTMVDLPLVPLDEQKAIASFLDVETSKIDALVSEQRRLIELLKEKRQAVISHAVTKGLNPNAPMKPSGIPWLGDVPEHWSVASVGHRYEIRVGKMLDSAKITGTQLKPYLRVADVQWGEINTEDLPEMDFDADAREKFRLSVGDLLVNEGGSYVGRSAIWKGELRECYYQKALHRLRPVNRSDDSSEFFFYVMLFATKFGVFVAGGNHNTIEHLPAVSLRKYRFGFPPVEEQTQIAEYLDERTAKFDALVAEAERAIELLQERRTALISAAVTGKIDVRRFTATESVL